jgi:pyridoxine 4-dehydrogenase
VRPPPATFRLGGELEVNRLGFGAMRITRIPHEDAHAILRRAVELGANLIDTADVYGHYESELRIAEALHPYPEGLVIATKGGLVNDGSASFPRDGRPEHLRAAVAGSLGRLRLERIDLYQLHRVDENVPIEESVGALAELRREGKIRLIGLSNVSVEELRRAQAVAPVASVQNQYSPDNRACEDVLEVAEGQGIAFLPWGPLGAGMPAAQALRWLLERSPVILPIPGTSSLEHLEENMA